MKNLHYIVLLLVIFVTFIFFYEKENSIYPVLEIISPTEIVIDLNKNGQKDNNETLNLSKIKSFTIYADKNKDVVNQYKLSIEDSINLGYLAEDYAKSVLEGKKVKIKEDDIIINNISYSKLLLNKGLAIKNNSEITSEVTKNINKAKNLNLVLLNTKSNKYHKLDCEYGQKSNIFIIIPASQLQKDSKPCKYCHVQKIKNKEKFIKKISLPTLNIKTNNTELILSDMTVNLKPNKNCTDKICQALLKEINLAKSSIDFAIYGYTKIPKIEEALINAKNRGVKIRFVFDQHNNTNIYPDTYHLAKIFPNNSDNARAIMHNKFFIFDRTKVLTGSANLSQTDMSGYSSNSIVIINSKEIANIYLQEFEQMYKGLFHEQKSKINTKNKSNVEIYFSPKDDIIINHIIPIIDKAQKYIYIPTFVITHKKLTQSLINAKKRGVDIKIILDATNTKPPSKINELRTANIQVKTENYAGKLHSKSLIIDDKYLVIGSMNFSVSGALYNDENVLILKDEKLAKHYKEFFDYLWTRIPDKWSKYSVRAESINSIGSCNDGIDNDYDGDIDTDDLGCKNYTKSK